MLNSKLNPVLIAVLLFTGAIFPLGAQSSAEEQENNLIAVLKSDASRKDKSDACRLLARVGTKKAVAPLAALLGDAELSHMARYGLEPIPDPSVDEALLKALGQLDGRLRIGVIGSLGVRREAKAVKPLKALLLNPDAPTAQAAARALGKISTLDAAKALQDALRGVPQPNQLAFCEGLLRCAETLAGTGQRDQALAIYDQLRHLSGPHQVRTAALRGAILTDPENGLPLLRKSLISEDYILFSAAARTSLEMPGTEVTGALAAALPQASTDHQILIIQTLGKRAEPSALPALFASARNGATDVRLAAIQALPMIGSENAVPVLVELLADADHPINQAAKESLASLPGPQTDAAVATLLGSPQASQRLNAIELASERRMTKCIPALLKAAGDKDPKVRPAALKAVGDLGSVEELKALLELLTHLTEPRDLNAAEQAVRTICAEAEQPEACAPQVMSVLTRSQPAQKGALLRILSSLGGTEALRAVRAAVDDSNSEVHAAAIRALGSWKTAEAATALFGLAKSAENSNDQILCLRAYLRLAARSDLPAGQRLSMCREATGLVERAEEKRMLLAALGGVDSAGSIEIITPYLDDPATREEASAAVVGISERLLKRRDTNSELAGKLIEPLRKVGQTTSNSGLADRASKALGQAQRRAGRG